VYDTLMESDAVEPSCRAEGDTRTGQTCKKTKDLSGCESEERGEGGVVYDTLTESDTVILLVAQKLSCRD
jgi:hypothetical protein